MAHIDLAVTVARARVVYVAFRPTLNCELSAAGAWTTAVIEAWIRQHWIRIAKYKLQPERIQDHCSNV
jgi:hypothetical protein